MKKLKQLLKFIVPYHFVVLWTSKSRRNRTWKMVEKKLLEQGALKTIEAPRTETFTYNKAINYLVEQKCSDSYTILEGSIPEASLDFCVPFICDLYQGRPLLGIHVGNFVGLSLAFFANLIRTLHPESRLVSIDPNIRHRGVANPLNTVVGLLNHFGLQDNCLILTGYSLEINPYIEKQPDNNPLISAFDQGLSCTQQLQGLAMISPAAYEFFVIDGNHLGAYLTREIASADRLLKPGGLLILDDITPYWGEIQEIYETIDPTRYHKLGSDGRVGILKKIC
ncbi:MAG: hypothetical protein Fur0044_05420 [Anaerolineae bacterium]|nr:class I SAM-dependent methyltransferase [Anaerolineales bacterium]MCQ3973510.1 hypothetical protein [Anaerolineae bacterium]